MPRQNDLIANVRDYKTRKIVSDLKLDNGVNIFYHFTKKESIERHPNRYNPGPRYSPTSEVGRTERTSREIGSRITNYGNWIKMEEKGYLEPEIKKIGLDLDRIIYAQDCDDFRDGSGPTYSGGEITEITTGGRGGIIHRSPIRASGFFMSTELTCEFTFYSITDNDRLQRDKFTAEAIAEDFPLSCSSNYGVSDIFHKRVIRGSGNSLLRATSKLVDRVFRKDHFERKVWELYERCLRGE